MKSPFLIVALAWLLAACSSLSVTEKNPTDDVWASSERVTLALATLESLSENLWFLGYQSVEELAPGSTTPHKYMLLDFRLEGETDPVRLTASASEICDSLYQNRSLLNDLNSLGYEDFAVSFDDAARHDCP